MVDSQPHSLIIRKCLYASRVDRFYNMKQCRKCEVQLTGLNWHVGSKRWGNNLCKECLKIQGREQYLKHRDERLANSRMYNATHKAQIKAQKRQYRLAHLQHELEKHRNYYRTHKDQAVKRQRQYSQTHRKELNAAQRKREAKMRLGALVFISSHNPPQCANPFNQHDSPYTTLESLSLDFIKGGHRKNGFRSSLPLYYGILNGSYAKSDWQVLCMNCQFIKKRRNREI